MQVCSTWSELSGACRARFGNRRTKPGGREHTSRAFNVDSEASALACAARASRHPLFCPVGRLP
eukprot:1461820-Alexandrium_andersonii.AAC.1